MDKNSSYDTTKKWKGSPIFARLYPKMAASGDNIGFATVREWAMSKTIGTGIEIGCGDGRNFDYLPDDVEILGIEPEEQLATAAKVRATGKPIRVVQGFAERTNLPSSSVDFVVSTLTLCSVSSIEQTLAEVSRLLKPGGKLISVEHCLAPGRLFPTWQRVADVVWPHLFGGCHTTRDIVPAIELAGFERVELEWFNFPSDRSLSPARWMFKGVFVKP
ncbi:class I SAM-dependent methyltransferase [Xenorhabdus bovienii]|uniref:class I SAM-dependent methyltransferase n=1 Tax=Xenorhabdus bovienii TaxID=40576 RepID=UPI002157A2F7|nr:class I SAM-dependent methyltransferase [Xenorhabdus bovienii]